jgi:uncharacterized membrane protein (UPF0127 family)
MTPGIVTFPSKATVSVDIAERPEEQAKGLSGRTSLTADSGMLFWFGTRADHGFWMKRTLIPLDIVFIDYGRVVGILTLQPLDERSFRCGRLSSCVLEVNGGFCEKNGILVGDSAQISLA